MVNVKTLFMAFLATTAIANPVGVLEERAGDSVTCKYKDEAGKQQSVTFSTSSAKTLAKKAPAGTAQTASGYPHEYQNFDNMKWPNSQCNSAKVKTLEFPIFTAKNKQNTLYDYTKKKDSNKPGPCRMVYAQTGGAFCGLMCHESMVENDDSRGFKLCK